MNKPCCGTWRIACEQNHPNCIDYYLQKKKPVTAYIYASSFISVETLLIFQKHGYLLNSCMDYYIKYNKFDIIKYIYENGHPPNIYEMIASCSTDTLEMMVYLKSINCPWDDSVYIEAIRRRSMIHIEYLYQNDCPITINVLFSALKSGLIKYVENIYNKCEASKIIITSDVYNHIVNIKCLAFIHSKNIQYPENYCDYIAEKCSLDMLKFIIDTGCNWSENVCPILTRTNKVDMFKFAHENGCPFGNGKNYKNIYGLVCNAGNYCMCKKYKELSAYVIPLDVPNIMIYDHNKPFNKYDMW